MISVFGSKIEEEEIDNVIQIMKSQWIGFGDKVIEFEKRFSKRFDISNFIMVDSGSNALFLAIRLLNLPIGSEIIIPSFTWVSCAQAVLMSGMKPVFCDVDKDSMNIDAKAIERQLTDNTKAIMVVHYAGLPVDMDEIKQFGLPIIEDAAHAVYSTYKNQHCGNIGEVGIYSFDAVKNLTAGEGGGLATQSQLLIERAKKLRYCGIGKSGFDRAINQVSGTCRWWEYNVSEPFIKMLPNNISAGIAIAQLEKIDELQSVRKRIWEIYQNEFEKLPWLIRPQEAQIGDKHSFFTYAIRVPKRDALANFMFENSVYTTLRYHPLHLNPIYSQQNKTLNNCKLLNEECLNIPLHPRLSDTEVEKVIDLIKRFGKNYI